MIRLEELKLSFASSNEPDAIGVEILSSRGDVVFEIWLHENGNRSMTFGRVEGEKCDAVGLHELITDCLTQLNEWAANLRKPGGTLVGRKRR